MRLNRGLYTCHGATLNVRVLKVYYQNGTKAMCKLAFETKKGEIVERKNYKLQLKNIQHWKHVQY